MSRKALKYFLITVVALTVLLGLTAGLFGLVVARVPEYRVQLQGWISGHTGMLVEFRTLSARLRLFGPEFVFDDAVVRTPDSSQILVLASRGSVGLDIWKSLLSGHLTIDRFSLDAPELALIRTADGRIQLVGQSAIADAQTPFSLSKLPVGSLRVRNAVLSFRDDMTGRGPWSLSGVNFILERQPNAAQLRGSASLPKSLGKILEFSANTEGMLAAPDTLFSSFVLKGAEIDLAGWADLLPDEWPAPESGRGSIRLVGSVRGGALSSLSGSLDLLNVVAVLPNWVTALPQAAVLRIPEFPPGVAVDTAAASAPMASQTTVAVIESVPVKPEIISYQRIAFEVRAQQRGEGWQVSLSDVDIARAGSPWHAGLLEMQWSRNADGALQVSSKADRVVLQNIWPLLAYFPESPALAQIRALRARGEIEDLSLSWQPSMGEQPARYSLRAKLDAVSIEPVLKTPGVTALNGVFALDEGGGEVTLDTRNLQFSLPWMFRKELDVQALRGRVAWRRQPDGLQMTSDQIELQTPNGAARVKFDLQPGSNGGSPIFNMDARISDVSIAAVNDYLPANKLTRKTLDWFERALLGGRIAYADIGLHGAIRSFPFRAGGGEFLARGRIEDMTFSYQAGFAPAVGLDGELEFRNQGMTLISATGNIGGMQVSQARGVFADFKRGEIDVTVQASGDLDDGLKYLQDSPLGNTLNEQLRTLRGRGAIDSTVALWLPLRRLAQRRSEVTTRFTDAAAWLPKVDAPITRLSGSLTVRQSLPETASLRGQWLGGPVSISLQPQSGLKQAALLKAQGRARAREMAPFLPDIVKIDGAAGWQMTTRLAAGEPIGEVRIQSDLEGLAIDMPYPLGKLDPEAIRTLRVDLEYQGANELLARGALGEVRALALIKRSNGRWAFERGGARADAVAAALPDHRGLRIEGSIDRLTLDDWFALRNSKPAGSSASASNARGGGRLADFLHAANLRIGTLQLYGFQWTDVRGVLQSVEREWRVDLAGPTLAGQLLIPEDFSGVLPLSATLERLAVTRVVGSPANSSAANTRDPRSWPGLDVRIADLKLDGRSIGAVTLQAARVEQGLQLESIAIEQPSLRAEGRGQWLMTAEGQRSNLSATLASTDLSATLLALNYPAFIEAKRGEIKAELNWPGGFDGDLLDHASGTLTLNIDEGQLRNVQPGAGRVLGLLSVAALPRRLSLDFSDLTDKGLSFDAIRGDFELRDGNAFTNNLLLSGPAVEIGVAGRTGLGAHDYDQTAVVTGSVGSSLPVAGALAAGPAVGAALLLFSRVFKEPLKGIARGYYRITGSWETPVVERVDAAAAKEAAANATEG